MDEDKDRDLLEEDDDLEEIPPVKFSKVKTTVILVAFLVIVLIGGLLLRGCSVEKKVENSSVSVNAEKASKGAKSDATEIYPNGREEDSKKLENSSVDGEVVSSRVKESSTSEKVDISPNSVPKEEQGIDKGINFAEVPEPVLSDSMSSTSMVSGKGVLRGSNSYLYVIDLVVLLDSDTTASVNYYCSRKTYDAIKEGDSLSITYQVDKDGVISVSSISR